MCVWGGGGGGGGGAEGVAYGLDWLFIHSNISGKIK